MDMKNSQLTLAITGEDKKTFDSFWVGGNQELVTVLQTVGEPNLAQMVYYYGPSGCGKSHLILATARLAQEARIPTYFFSLAEAYVVPEMLSQIDVSGVVCIDNLHAWAGDEEKERALFTLFEQIKHARGTLTVSAVQPPELNGFGLPDLVSRLGSGLIYPIQALNDSERLQALKMRAENRSLIINDDVLAFLVNRMSRDNHELFAFLDKMDKASLVEKRKITIPFVQGLLKA